jgi:hypothetical protein
MKRVCRYEFFFVGRTSDGHPTPAMYYVVNKRWLAVRRKRRKNVGRTSDVYGTEFMSNVRPTSTQLRPTPDDFTSDVRLTIYVDVRRGYPCFTPMIPLFPPCFPPVFPLYTPVLAVRWPSDGRRTDVGRNFVGRTSDVISSVRPASDILPTVVRPTFLRRICRT